MTAANNRALYVQKQDCRREPRQQEYVEQGEYLEHGPIASEERRRDSRFSGAPGWLFPLGMFMQLFADNLLHRHGSKKVPKVSGLLGWIMESPQASFDESRGVSWHGIYLRRVTTSQTPAGMLEGKPLPICPARFGKPNTEQWPDEDDFVPPSGSRPPGVGVVHAAHEDPMTAFRNPSPMTPVHEVEKGAAAGREQPSPAWAGRTQEMMCTGWCCVDTMTHDLQVPRLA
ncbi:hypothetical protein Micbo1qcDRAFT_173336 [Microdochium bolleyi]|uniref:Uncharacterized protein n=1 Tax=Microdochium bolleyi TaxID=196109 RepID=A0A136JBI3_9PEZI|nr:hypothetical protein Micbo1qcDRAFT_173336 [Microdochium bolleyi]